MNRRKILLSTFALIVLVVFGIIGYGIGFFKQSQWFTMFPALVFALIMEAVYWFRPLMLKQNRQEILLARICSHLTSMGIYFGWGLHRYGLHKALLIVFCVVILIELVFWFTQNLELVKRLVPNRYKEVSLTTWKVYLVASLFLLVMGGLVGFATATDEGSWYIPGGTIVLLVIEFAFFIYHDARKKNWEDVVLSEVMLFSMTFGIAAGWTYTTYGQFGSLAIVVVGALLLTEIEVCLFSALANCANLKRLQLPPLEYGRGFYWWLAFFAPIGWIREWISGLWKKEKK